MSWSRPPWEADHELDAEGVASLLPEIAPDLAGEPVAAVGEGWDFRAFAAGEEILRFAKRAEVRASMEAEARLLGIVAGRVPLEVPRPVVHPPHPRAPHGFARYRRVPGRPLREVRVGSEQARWLAARLGHFLRDLHAIPLDAVASAGLPRAGWEQAAGAARRSAARLRSLARHLPREILQRAQRVVSSPPAAGAGDGTLIHSDPWPEHLLVDEVSHELTGIIDWADAEIGDPAQDFAAGWFLAGDDGLEACLRAAGVPSSPDLVRRAVFFAVHHAIGDAWYATERGSGDDLRWSRAALARLP